MSKVRALNQDFFKKWTPDMAYVLGYFAADGSMIKNKRGAHFIEFTTTDRKMLVCIKNSISSDHVITERHRKNGENWKVQYRLQIGSKTWFTALSARGFTQRKSGTMRLPHIPAHLFGDFVRGYFDGDGCVYFKFHYSKWHKKSRWSFTTRFTSGSRVFLEQLHHCLIARGVKGGHLAHKIRGFELVFSRYDSLALYRIMYDTEPTSNLFLLRKREKLERAIRVLGLGKRE